MRKIILGIFGLLVAFGLVLGAGANFSDYNASRSVHWEIVPDDNELIDLTPLQPYAYISDAGVLVIDFSTENPNYPGYGDGISPSAEYNFDEVFEVSNDLWEDNMTIVVRITSSVTGIEFYGHEGDVHEVANGTVVSSSDVADEDVCFVVGPNDAVKVGIDISTDGDTPGDVWDEHMTIKAYRLGTEPAELVGKCGQ